MQEPNTAYVVEVYDQADFCQVHQRRAFTIERSAESWGFEQTKAFNEKDEFGGWSYRVIPMRLVTT